MCYCIELRCVTKCPLFIHHFPSSIIAILFIENLICIRSARTYIPLHCILFINHSKQVQMIAAHSFTLKSNLSRYLFKLFNHIIFSIILSHCAQLVIFNTLINVIWWFNMFDFVEGLLYSGNSILSYIFDFSFITTLQLNFSFGSKSYVSCNIRFWDCSNSLLCKFLAYVLRKRKDNQESRVWGIAYAVSNPLCYVFILSRYSAFRFQLLACMDAHA
jgi:hypothetical protein